MSISVFTIENVLKCQNTLGTFRPNVKTHIWIDGQQRLSSLYIALKGGFAYENSSKKELYLNLFSDLSNKNQDDGGNERFKFLTEEEANGENKWFKVKNILKFEDEFDVIKFALHKYKNDKAGKNLCALFKF